MHDSSHPAVAAPTLTPLQRLWLCEGIRLHEQHNPPLEDSEACRLARQHDGRLEERIELRNLSLASREGLVAALQQWLAATRWLAIVLLLLALATGAGLAGTAFSRSADTINVVWALLGLLGVHLLTLLFWLGGLLYRPGQPSQFMQLPLSLLEWLSRSPRAAQLTAALLSLLGRNRLLPAALSRLIHGWWSLVLLTALLVSLLLLGIHRYAFVWETTIASAEVFIALVRGLGWPLQLLGFAVPDVELIRSSGEQALADEASRQTWASWLMGMLVVYGLLPRLLLAGFYQWRWLRGRQRLQLDGQSAEWAWLLPRLQPAARSASIVDPQPAPLPNAPVTAFRIAAGSGTCLAGLELEEPLTWPAQLPERIHLLGNLDGYPAQQALLEQLAENPCQQLILACDARRSPDRGSLHFIGELARSCESLAVWLLHPQTDTQRLAGWQQALDRLGIHHDTATPWPAEETDDA